MLMQLPLGDFNRAIFTRHDGWWRSCSGEEYRRSVRAEQADKCIRREPHRLVPPFQTLLSGLVVELVWLVEREYEL